MVALTCELPFRLRPLRQQQTATILAAAPGDVKSRSLKNARRDDDSFPGLEQSLLFPQIAKGPYIFQRKTEADLTFVSGTEVELAKFESYPATIPIVG
jgi:hypothetical protein